MENEHYINVADLTNPMTGKTYRQENNEKQHKIPLGSLVEVDVGGEMDRHGLRMWVVRHDRDCDGMPLYSLSFEKDWTPSKYDFLPKFSRNMMIDSGYSESCLKIINTP